MRKYILAAGAALAMAAAQPAAAYTFSGDYTVDAHSPSDGNGLIIGTADHADPLTFALNNVGDTASVNLFYIFADEDSIQADDTVLKKIYVTFDFDQPSGFGGTVEGDTWGTKTVYAWGLFNIQTGYVDFDNNPTEMSFNGGKLNVSLRDASFSTGPYGLYGPANVVKADFTLTAVPEPATWAMMITGFGLAGSAIRRRRSTLAVA